MPKKTKTITLKGPFRHLGVDKVGEATGYRIEKITDSLEFNPGDSMSRKQADELCAANDWKVTIIPYE